MFINMVKTAQNWYFAGLIRVLHVLDVHVITRVERVCEAKLLVLIFRDNLQPDSHVC